MSRWRRVKKNLRTPRAQVDLETQDAVIKRGRRVTQHREVLEVEIGRLNEALALGSFDGRESPTFDGVGAFTESKDHLIGVKG